MLSVERPNRLFRARNYPVANQILRPNAAALPLKFCRNVTTTCCEAHRRCPQQFADYRYRKRSGILSRASRDGEVSGVTAS
jgi:hypothetical protein